MQKPKKNFTSLLDLAVERIFDFAGEHPPASNTLLETITLAGEFPLILQRPWLLAADLVTNISNAKQLLEINLNKYNFSKDRSFKVCFLGTTKSEDLQAVRSFNLQGKDCVERKVVSYELKGDFLPQESLECIVALEPDLSTANWEDILVNTIENVKNHPSAA